MPRILCPVLIMLLIVPAFSSAEIKTYTHSVKQPFAGSQSPDDARVAAIHKAKCEVLEMTGTYLESLTIVRNSMVEKDEILALAAGVFKAEVVSEKKYLEGNEFGIYVSAKVDVNTSIIDERINKLLKDRELLRKYQESQKREKELLAKIEQLEKETRKLQNSSTPIDKQKKWELTNQFQEAIKGLNAVEWYNKVLSLKTYGEYTADVASEAIEYLNNAISLDKGYGSAYNLLGWIYDDTDDYDRAIESYQKALKIGLKEFGPEHPEVAVRHNNLGAAYDHKGDYGRAIEYYQKALKIALKKLGRNHPYTKTYQKNLDSAKK